MARTSLTVNALTLAGKKITGNTTTGTADGHDFVNTGQEYVYVENTDGAATRDVIFKAQGNVDGADFSDETITIALSSWIIAGPFEPSVFNTSHKVQIDFDSGNEGDLETYVFSFTEPTS